MNASADTTHGLEGAHSGGLLWPAHHNEWHAWATPKTCQFASHRLNTASNRRGAATHSSVELTASLSVSRASFLKTGGVLRVWTTQAVCIPSTCASCKALAHMRATRMCVPRCPWRVCAGAIQDMAMRSKVRAAGGLLAPALARGAQGVWFCAVGGPMTSHAHGCGRAPYQGPAHRQEGPQIWQPGCLRRGQSSGARWP